MTLEPAIPGQADASAPLTYDTTIDRALVHRAAVSEVFLTDIRAIDDRTVLIAAQLPRCHGYFNDHTKWSVTVDPLLLFEVARQATLASAHALKVPQKTILISSECELDIQDIAAFADPEKPTAITIENTFDWTAMRRGEPRAGICKQVILVNSQIAATHWSSGQLMSHNQLAALRAEQRGDLPPWTAQMTDRPDGVALPPNSVGRTNPLNVVLAQLEIADGIVRANIAPPWQNRALFDHSYDHLTMQILTEAARQVAMLTLSQQPGAKVDNWDVHFVKGKFGQFAEIDLPVVVKAQIPVEQADAVRVAVEIVQAGQVIATITLGLSTDTKGQDNGQS